jgi:AraC-like DNA-binding protein
MFARSDNRMQRSSLIGAHSQPAGQAGRDDRVPFADKQVSVQPFAFASLSSKLESLRSPAIDEIDNVKYLPLIWSDIWRKPGRTTLMLLQVAVAFALFGGLLGMKTGVDQSKGLEGSGEAPLRIDQLAKMAGMGVSTLHRHFHEPTDMSPIQYQKRLRLDEARRLMLEESYEVTDGCAGCRL